MKKNNVKMIFKCKTHQGYVIKILAEVLQNNIKTACFEIDREGISLRMPDQKRKVLLDMKLDSENFQVYKYQSVKSTLFIGVNLTHFYKMIKSTKKKDSIVLFIDSEESTELGIQIIPKENNRITTSYITIQTIQQLQVSLPTGYKSSVLVPSSDFQKLVKEMQPINSEIDILSNEHSISFRCNAGGIMKRHVDFGDIVEVGETQELDYTKTFFTEQLCRIAKISGLSKHTRIFTSEGLPIKFKSHIGDLGTLIVYIKSKDQIEHV